MQEKQEHFCAQLAREDKEPLLGTATHVNVWLLLEVREPWRAKATTDNDLPALAQSYLAEQLAAIPASRLLFIRQPSPAQKRRRFFVVRTDEAEPALYEFELDEYEALAALDFMAVIDADEAFAANRRAEPLFLVCTNGTRDRCCAKFGVPLYKALLDRRPESTWQSTHIGGHRYAPNVLFLPHSANYGHLTSEEVGPAVDAYLAGKLYDLERYRGRTYYAPPVQAADTFLRQALDLLDLAGLRLRTAELEGEDIWRVRFDLPASGETHEIVLQSRKTERPRLVSCSSPASKPVALYRLIAHRAVISS